MEELELTPEQFQQMLEQIQRLLKKMEGELSELTRALLTGNRGELERLLRGGESGSRSRFPRQFPADTLYEDGRPATTGSRPYRGGGLQGHAANAG